MDIITRDVLEELAQSRPQPCCVSIYLPTERVEAEQSQNPIRLKNLLKEARRLLVSEGLGEEEINQILNPAQELLSQTTFWRRISDGLCLFLSRDSARIFRVPVSFGEFVDCAGRFHLKPLFPLIASNNQYYVLGLSQNRVRFFQGTHYNLSEITPEDLPEGIADALFDELDEVSLQFHSIQQGGTGKETIYHGQGYAGEEFRSRPHDRLKRYFDRIDAALRKVLHDERAPLVLAGVEYYLPIYREANKYQHLVEDEIVAGNPDGLTLHELHEKTWEVVEPLFLRSQNEGIEAFEEEYNVNNGLASTDLKDILPAAAYGRVDTLFVAIGQEQWGRFDEENNVVELTGTQEPGTEDLLDYAAVQTYLNRGTVHALRPENMPNGATLAATFRYELDVSAETRSNGEPATR